MSIFTMTVPSINKDVVEHVRAEVGLDEEKMKEAIQLLREWLNLQPHLPHNCEDARLERWILRCKNSLERAKSSIDMYYTLKNVIPELLTERDPCGEWFKKLSSVGYAVLIPQMTDDYCRVSLIGLFDHDPEKLNMDHLFKALFMFLDMRMCEDYNTADIYVLDLAGVTVGHITKINLALLKKVQICLVKGFNTRIKEIHYINVPTYAEVVVNIFKSLLKPKLASRLHVHPKGSLNLTEKISPKLLPAEFGGENGTIAEHWSNRIKKAELYRDWFVEQDKYKADESKRPGKAFDSGELFGIEGTFRKLTVD